MVLRSTNATTPPDMILGSYYLTHPGVDERDTPAGKKNDGKVFTDIDEMLMAHRELKVGLHAKIRMYKDEDDKQGKLVESTVWKIYLPARGNSAGPGLCRSEADPYAPCAIRKSWDRSSTAATRSTETPGRCVMLDYIRQASTIPQNMHYHWYFDMEMREAKQDH